MPAASDVTLGGSAGRLWGNLQVISCLHLQNCVSSSALLAAAVLGSDMDMLVKLKQRLAVVSAALTSKSLH